MIYQGCGQALAGLSMEEQADWRHNGWGWLRSGSEASLRWAPPRVSLSQGSSLDFLHFGILFI